MLGASSLPLLAMAAPATAPATVPAASAAADPSASAPTFAGGCVESIPSSGARPKISDTFPARGTTGYATTLRVLIEHGRGENVLPNGLSLQSAGDAAKALKSAGFVVPDQDGGAPARLSIMPPDPNAKAGSSAASGDRVTSLLEFPLVPLPDKAGRQTLTLPPVPVAVARASGEIATLCTKPHTITVEDPTASTPQAKPRANPPPRVQREEWTSLKRALMYGAAGIVLGAILAYFIRRYLRRPRPAPPPPPPRPPWEVALERLDEVRHAGLLEVQRHSEYFDRVSDAVRSYLGARYDFDGLESTSDEILAALRRARIASPALPYDVISSFLGDCDLVKFARATPTPEDCARALAAGETIVRATMPRFGPSGPFTAPPPPPPSAPAAPPSASAAPPADAMPEGDTEIRA
jgi:hypothetical protein